MRHSKSWAGLLSEQATLAELYARAMHECRHQDAYILAQGMQGNSYALLGAARSASNVAPEPPRKARWQNLPATERAAIKASHRVDAPTRYRS
jgi:hypothetical protein